MQLDLWKFENMFIFDSTIADCSAVRPVSAVLRDAISTSAEWRRIVEMWNKSSSRIGQRHGDIFDMKSLLNSISNNFQIDESNSTRSNKLEQ